MAALRRLGLGPGRFADSAWSGRASGPFVLGGGDHVMNFGRRLRGAALAAVVLVLTVGCTAGSADAPTSTAIVSVTVSPSVIDPSSLRPSPTEPSPSAPPSAPPSVPSSAAESSASPPSSEISPQEAADRAAIEAQWVKFWRTYVDIVRTPSEQRAAALDNVSVDPTKGRVLKDASDLEGQGLDNYGDVVLNIYGIDLLGDGNSAVIQDCQDQSGFGSVFVESGKKRTVGIDHNHMQAGLVRGADGIWRVQTLQYVENQPC